VIQKKLILTRYLSYTKKLIVIRYSSYFTWFVFTKAFQAYILLVGTFFLVFLQFYLLRHNREDPHLPEPIENVNSPLSKIKKTFSSTFDRFRRPSQRTENINAIRQLAARTGGETVVTDGSNENNEQNDVNNNNNDNRPRPRSVTFNIRYTFIIAS